MADIEFDNWPQGEGDEGVCTTESYRMTATGCGLFDLIEWQCVSWPGKEDGDTGNEATFTNPRGLETLVRFPAQGKYVLRVLCREPA